ncbi:universal stress protein [uncultured Mycobacterium sp.]|uniref:universal stress protein n=1 Tax=uncultured Mycobacterium sp. TaxID=171292 RepID=UPI0035CC9D45
MNCSQTPSGVVVGVDCSTAALRAALWAVDEAISRDIPLRLVHALDGEDRGSNDTAREFAIAESAIRHVIAAVEATGKPVKLEVELTRGRAMSTLVQTSRRAAMVCVGAMGANHFRPGRVGSTAVGVATSAQCPVAVIRGHGRPTRPDGNWIFVEVGRSPDDGVVLETAVNEARLRNAPIRVITSWQPPRVDPEAAGEGDRRILAQLNRRLARWRRRYPDLQAEAVAAHGTISDYLATHAAEAQLLVVDARGPGVVQEVLGPAGNAALANSDCVVLVLNRPHL